MSSSCRPLQKFSRRCSKSFRYNSLRITSRCAADATWISRAISPSPYPSSRRNSLAGRVPARVVRAKDPPRFSEPRERNASATPFRNHGDRFGGKGMGFYKIGSFFLFFYKSVSPSPSNALKIKNLLDRRHWLAECLTIRSPKNSEVG